MMSYSTILPMILLTCLGLFESPEASASGSVGEWSHFPGSPQPGEYGIEALDLAGDGNFVAVTAGYRTVSGDYLPRSFLMLFEPRDEGFGVGRHVMLPADGRIRGQIRRYTTAGASGDVLAVHYSDHGYPGYNNRLLALAGPNLEVIAETPLPNNFQVVDIVDPDGDGRPEIIGILRETWFTPVPRILDIGSGEIIWSGGGLSGDSIAYGQVGSGQKVLVVGSSGTVPGVVLDAITREVLGTWPDGFRGTVVFGNFIGPDSDKEFAVVGDQGLTKVFRVSPSLSPMVEFQTGHQRVASVADVDNDGFDEILVGNSGWDGIKAYQPRLGGEVLIEYENPNVGVYSMDIMGAAGDPHRHLVFGSGSISSASRQLLRIVALADGEIRFEQLSELGPFNAVEIGSILGEPSNEQVLYANRGSDSWEGVDLFVLDKESGSILTGGSTELSSGATLHDGRFDIALAQLDNDAQLEIVASSSFSSGGNMAAFDGLSIKPQWRIPVYSNSGAVGPVLASDLDEDGVDEVLAIAGGSLAILDGVLGTEIWRSTTLNVNGAKSLVVGPIGLDGEIGAGIGVGSRVYVMDLMKRAIQRFYEFDQEVIGQHVEVREGQCIHVLTFAGWLQRRDCSTGAVLSWREFAQDAVFVGYPGDSFGDIVLSNGQRLDVERDGRVIRTSRHVDFELGLGNRGFARYEGDEIEVLIGGTFGVHKIRLDTDSVFQSGFEMP